MERSQGFRPRGSGLSLALALVLGCGATRSGNTDPAGRPDGGGASVGAGAATSTGGSAVTPQGGTSQGYGIDLTGSPKYFRFVRLTNAQWGATVQQLLKLPEPSGLEQSFEAPVRGQTDFSNNELLLDVNQRRWADFQSAAEALAERVTASDEALANVYPGTDAVGFIESVGRRAYRRPLTVDEVSAYRTLFTTGSAMSGTKSSFAKGAALVLRALLQSPHFLYRTELGKTGEPLSGYEIAAKLALWLRGAAPDDTLLDAAESLTTPRDLGEYASEMLAEAAPTMRTFYGELLHFDRYAQISKVGVPSFDPSLTGELEESSYRFFERIFSQGAGLRDILTSTRGFMGPGMAALYGLPSPSSGFAEAELDASRVGYFSQLPFLLLHSVNAEPDSLHRGLSLAVDVLCSPLGPPSEGVPPIPERLDGQTRRQYVESLTDACGAACHNEVMNPLGFAFEHFDGMGQYRDVEGAGLRIDSSGSYTFSDGRVDFADHAELMQAMVSSTNAHACYAKKLASYSLQRDITTKDWPWLEKLANLSHDASSTQELMLALIFSDAFRVHGGAP
jgi:hypothetical protein